MVPEDPQFTLKLASDPLDFTAAQRLRYRVFVNELGGNGPLVDHAAKLEKDQFDPFYDHLILIDNKRDAKDLNHVIGAYRMLRSDLAAKAGGFYSEGEYDLKPLLDSGRSLLELGRSCVDIEYRGGKAMYYLWTGLAEYVQEHGVEILFGVASFHGTDPHSLAAPLSLLHHRYLAPEGLRVRVKEEYHQPMNLMEPEKIDRLGAMRVTPALIKAYLRLGGFVGDGAYIDHAFNTTDVCLVVDINRMNERQSGLYRKG